MKLFIHLIIFSFLVSFSTAAQTVKKKKATPIKKSQKSPEKKQLLEYLRGKIISFGDNIANVSYDTDSCTLSLKYLEKIFWTDQNLSNLNANGISWDIVTSKFDPSQQSLKIQIASTLGTYAEERFFRTIADVKEKAIENNRTYEDQIWYMIDHYKIEDCSYIEKNGEIYLTKIYTTLLFNLTKSGSEPNFQENITNTYKKLIKLCSK